MEIILPEFFYCVVKLGVGGFSMGAATALYSATCFTAGKYGNGNPYPVALNAAVGLSGWLPCAKYDTVLIYQTLFIHFATYLLSITYKFYSLFFIRILPNKIKGVEEATRHAASLPILLCHGKGIC